MSVYTYIGNSDPHNHVSRIVLRGGGLVLLQNQYADLTDAEVAYLQQDYVLIAGAVGTPAVAPHKGAISFFDLSDTPSTLGLNQTVVGDGNGGLFAKTVPDGGGGGGGGSAAANLTGTLACIGPSTEAKWGNPVDYDTPTVVDAANTGLSVDGQGAMLNYWLNGSVRFVYNGGESGDTSTQIISRMEAVIAAANAAAGGEVSWWLLGQLYGNDFSVIDADTAIAHMITIMTRFDSEPGWKMIETMVNRDAGTAGTLTNPSGGVYSSAEYIEYVRKCTDFQKKWVNDHDGWLLVDAHSAVTRNSVYITNHAVDGIHLSNLGGDKVARAMAKVMRPRIVEDDRLAEQPDNTTLFGAYHFLSGSAGNDIQAAVVANATGGTYQLQITSSLYDIAPGITSAIPWNAPAATVQAALEAVWGAGNFAVTGNSSPWDHFITFQGAYAGKTMPLMTMVSALTGTSGTPAVSRTASGGSANTWTLTNNTGFKGSIEARDDAYGNWQVLTAIQAGASVGFGKTFTTGFLLNGMKIYAEAELCVYQEWVNPLKCEFILNPQVPISISTCWCSTTGKSPSPLSPNPGPSYGVIRTPVLQVARDFTAGALLLTFAADAPSEVRIGRVGIRAVL